jgi:hypothetical protein
MPRTLSPDVIAEKDKDYNWPIELYQIKLDEETLYFAMFPEDINFFDEAVNPQTYYAASISRGSVKKDNQTNPNTSEITFDNVMREFSAYVANTDFVGRKVTIWKVFKNHLGNSENYVEIFTDAIIDSVSIDEYNLTAQIVSNLDALDVELPGETYQVNCRFEFGGEACGVNIPTKSGQIDSISGSMINNSAITESADYWKYGTIEVGNESRKIVASGNGYVELEYPFGSAQTGDSYSMQGGCDYSYDAGHGCTFWSNTQFYGGFLDIPKIRNIRSVD